jgi:glyoxylase-like metal-dependent hydrolase (beta-lactamase superfamily II)
LNPAVPAATWERFEAALWSTTSLLVSAEGESLVVDPAISADEVADIARRALELGAPVRNVLITHGDWDHVCGIAGFGDAVAVMGEQTAERVLSRDPAVLGQAAEHYGLKIAGLPRVDRTFSRGSAIALGPFGVETFPLVGHTDDGTGFRIRDEGLLIVGDHLSPVEFPFAKSPAAYRFTLAGLIETLRTDPPEAVIPGHGPPLEPADALRIAEADLVYLRALHAAVAGAATREEAHAAGSAVDLPRECAPDLAEMQGFNVDRQIDEIFAG